MAGMTRYIIVKTNKGYDELARCVNDAINNGYVPIGNPINMGGDGCSWVGQAMIHAPWPT